MSRTLLALAALGLAACEPEEACPEESGVVCTYAGSDQIGYDGGGLDRRESMLYFPMEIEVSPYGKPAISDWNNHKIRIVEDDDTLTTIMGTPFVGDGDPDRADMTEAGADGLDVALNHPTENAYYPDGTLLSASWHTHKFRTWDPETGKVHVVIGSTPGYGGDGGPGKDALVNQPRAVIVDSTSTAWFVDMRNERIRKLGTDGIVSLVAGNGTQEFCGDGGPALAACFRFPKSANPEPGGALALDETSNLLYVADTENHRIRVIDLTTGLITTFAGTGTPGYAGDGGPAAAAQFNFPRDISLDDDGHLLVADTDNHVIRSIDLDDGTIDTVVGNGNDGFSGDGGPATSAELFRPFSVDAGLDGEIFFADTFNHRIRVVYP